ncbi:MAG: hypothetical protein JSW41_01075 [Candidatus Aenigmatarchaeota archaeon]|nr:MAG: hypothetical protein JSW41_01075 [Candidatus Aenigmarchaeota archaeon]
MMGVDILARTYLKRMNKLDSINILLRFIYESDMDMDKIDKNDVIIKMMSLGLEIDLNLDEIGRYIKRDLGVLKNHTLSDYGGVEDDGEVFEG